MRNIAKSALASVPVTGLVTALLVVAPGTARAQTGILNACYMPETGVMYLIKRSGLPDACRSDDHVEIAFRTVPQTTATAAGAAPPPGAGGPPAGAGPQVVQSLNTLNGAVTLTGTGGTTITDDGLGAIVIDTHDRYTDPEATAAMGETDDSNPLNHDRYTDADAIAAVGPGSGWSLSGNAGTTPGTNFLGTTDDQSLEFRVNGLRVLRLEPTEQGGNSAPNMIGGFSANGVVAGVVGATISGGGFLNDPNQVTASFGTVGGGFDNTAGSTSTVAGGLRGNASGIAATIGGGQLNTASGNGATVGGGGTNTASSSFATVAGGDQNTASVGSFPFVGGGRENAATASFAVVAGGLRNTASTFYATVPGGRLNSAAGQYSFAAGRRAKANHDGTFVWADHTDADFGSTAADQFLIRASGGVGIGTDNPGSPLTVAGTVESTVGGFKFPDGSVQTTAATGGGGGLTRTVYSGTCQPNHVPGFSFDAGVLRDGDIISDPTITLADPPAVTAYVINDFPPVGGTLNAYFDGVFVQEGQIVILCDGGSVGFPAWNYRVVVVK